MLRLTRHARLSLGILVATLLASLGPATNAPARAAASTVAPAAPSAKIPHTHRPPRDFVPAPLPHAGGGTVVRFHGHPILIPTHAHLTLALRTLLLGPSTPSLPAPHRPAPTPRTGGHAGLQMALRPRALMAAPTAPSPPPPVSIDAVQGRFFTYPTNNGVFVTPTTVPVFTEQFPAIDFNPPSYAQVSCTNSTGVSEQNPPFADVIPQADGSCAVQVAQGNGQVAGVGALSAFEAVFTARLTVAQAGQITFNLFSDDGWILASGPDDSGDQPTHVSGALDSTLQTATGALTG